jgi:hypothetical protein
MSRRIPDPVGLIAGIAFTGIGLAFLVGEVELANRARWVWPIALFSVGAGILAAVLGHPSEQAVDAAGATATGAGSSTDLSGPAAGAGTPEPWHEPGTAAQERSDTAAWPHTEVQPAAEEPSSTEAWAGVEAEARPAAAPVPEEPSGTPAWSHGESPADAKAATAAEERPGTAPGSVVDGEAAAADEPEAAPSSGADEDATEEHDRRQAGGPPA